MPRIRTIKPEAHTDEATGTLTDFEWRLFVGLWNYADDIGVFELNAAELRVKIYPYRPKSVTKLIESTIVDKLSKFIFIFKFEGKIFGWIKNFKKHQKITHVGKLIFEEDQFRKILENTGNVPLEGKGREGNSIRVGKEEELSASPHDVLFTEVYNLYPGKTGRKLAESHFKSSVKTPEDFDLIKKALQNYITSQRVKNGFIQNASTWFNNWKDWINYKDPEVILNGRNAVGTNAGEAAPRPGKYAE